MTRGLTRVNLTQRRIGLRTLGSGGRLCFLGDVRFGSGSQLGGNWRVDDRVGSAWSGEIRYRRRRLQSGTRHDRVAWKRGRHLPAGLGR